MVPFCPEKGAGEMRAAGRRPRKSGSRQRGCFRRGCAPHFLFETSKRKCAAPGGKEKMFGGSGRIYASLLPPAGESWHFLVEVRDGNARPLGKSFGPGKYKDTSCADFRCRWPVVDESCSIGQGNSFCEHRAARSEAERAERGAGQMRSCTPTTSAPSATGR